MTPGSHATGWQGRSVGGRATPAACATLPASPRRLGAQHVALALHVDLQLHQFGHIVNDIGPLQASALLLQQILEPLAQEQRQEGADDVAHGRLVALVPDRARLQQRLHREESVLHHPETVNSHATLAIKLSVSHEYI